MAISTLKLVKLRTIEAIKYDANALKWPLVAAVQVVIWLLRLVGKHDKAFKIASMVYRTGWAGGFGVGLRTARYYFVKRRDLGKKLVDDMVEHLPPLERTKKFFDNPQQMLSGIIQVLKQPRGDERGVLLLNYSYYFPMFLKFVDVEEVGKRYTIVLEPSWAGFCELGILAYGLLDMPVVLMTYEQRDRRFIDQLGIDLMPVDIGPNWFVDHTNFVEAPADQERDIDIIMVAGWADFKRHAQFFKGLRKLKAKGRSPKVTLVGYPVDFTMDDIKSMASRYGVDDLVIWYEWITPAEVAGLLQRAKVNILWSRFEGNNRAIIEGMLCGVPGILRQGHNYGQHYAYMNPQTGRYADESSLPAAIDEILANFSTFTPRQWVLDHRSCIIATHRLDDVLQAYEQEQGRPWTANLEPKVNELHGMAYLDKAKRNDFADAYEELKAYFVKPK